MVKCFIFDLDGTLLDTLTTITYYVNKTLREEGFEPITEDECKYFVGNGPEQLIRRALESKGYADEGGVSRILKKYKQNYSADPFYLTAPYDGVPELLSALRERGMKIAVLSNKQDGAAVPVVGHFFGETVDLARGGRDGVPLKPAPDAVYAMLEELGVLPDEVVYVGDTGVDMQTARAFGAHRAVGVLWGFRDREELSENGADAVISAPSELLSEVDR